MNLALVVLFTLADDAAAQRFDALVAQALPGIRAQEPGTLQYLPHAVVGQPLQRVIYAQYADRAAHAVHNGRPEMAALLTELPALTTAVRVEELVPAPPGGTGG